MRDDYRKGFLAGTLIGFAAGIIMMLIFETLAYVIG